MPTFLQFALLRGMELQDKRSAKRLKHTGNLEQNIHFTTEVD